MLRQYENSIDDKRQFTALVKDIFPEEAKNINLILMAESKKELESVCETVETIGKRNSCTIDTHYLKQREALNTALDRLQLTGQIF